MAVAQTKLTETQIAGSNPAKYVEVWHQGHGKRLGNLGSEHLEHSTSGNSQLARVSSYPSALRQDAAKMLWCWMYVMRSPEHQRYVTLESMYAMIWQIL